MQVCFKPMLSVLLITLFLSSPALGSCTDESCSHEFNLDDIRTIVGSYWDSNYPEAQDSPEFVARKKNSQEVFVDLANIVQNFTLSPKVVATIEKIARGETDEQPSARVGGGYYHTAQGYIGRVVEEVINWLVLQGYFISPDYMNALLDYVEVSQHGRTPGHERTRRDYEVNTSGIGILVSPGEMKMNFTVGNSKNMTDKFAHRSGEARPGAQDRKVSNFCPVEYAHYKTCASLIAVDYMKEAAKRAGYLMQGLTKYFSSLSY